jgi:hypothetical protein
LLIFGNGGAGGKEAFMAVEFVVSFFVSISLIGTGRSKFMKVASFSDAAVSFVTS